MKNKFYAYQNEDKWILMYDAFTFKLVKNLNKASYFLSKEDAHTWESYIKKMYPLSKLVELELHPVKSEHHRDLEIVYKTKIGPIPVIVYKDINNNYFTNIAS